MEALSHVHNLHKKAMPFMFREFHTSVLDQLPVSKQLLVSDGANFADFNRALNNLGYKTPNYDVVFSATDKFCKKYRVTPSFWRQAVPELGSSGFSATVMVHGSVAESELNGTRNSYQHPSVRDSATAVGVALSKLEELTELKPAAVMLDALAAYSLANTVLIDQEADEERKADEELLATMRKTQQARKQAAGGLV